LPAFPSIPTALPVPERLLIGLLMMRRCCGDSVPADLLETLSAVPVD